MMRSKKHRIMFVCHGNICRSPMAEFIFKDMLSKRGISDSFVVASSATSTEEIIDNVGNPVYPPARVELSRHGIDPGDKRAVQIKASDYDKYDLFLVMDSRNMQNILYIFGSDREDKVKRLMDFTSRGGDVADPWYTGRFDIAYKDIYDGCKGLLDSLTQSESI